MRFLLLNDDRSPPRFQCFPEYNFFDTRTFHTSQFSIDELFDDALVLIHDDRSAAVAAECPAVVYGVLHLLLLLVAMVLRGSVIVPVITLMLVLDWVARGVVVGVVATASAAGAETGPVAAEGAAPASRLAPR